MSREQDPDAWKVVLDDEFYRPDDVALAFYKKETGVEDEAELKQHILQVQRDAFSIFTYPCIRNFGFTWMKFVRQPAYEHVLKLGMERKNPIFIDLGCCFGNDSRKLVQDGYPVQSVIAVDLRKGLWELGHRLFRSTPETYPVHFLEGDIFDPEFLTTVPPLPTSSAPPSAPLPELHSLTSLNPLHGRVSASFMGSFFHLFDADNQYQLAKSLAGLLSPESGSILVGVHGGAAEKGFWQPTVGNYKMFCHSPESWIEMWHDVFSEGKGGDGGVEVKARLRREVGGDDYFKTWPGNKNPFHVLEWSVMRK
ncbi:hypothetical protein BC835DRAFT_403510 [Cytidiella melzeri]|nr:hypothetical protein BC835DRAFT_403510 [Cytidiella melzeri]